VVKNLAPSSETEGPFAGRRGSIFPPEANAANGRLGGSRVVTGLVTSTPNEGPRANETRPFPRDLSRECGFSDQLSAAVLIQRWW
jgi:hypothetical protein